MVAYEKINEQSKTLRDILRTLKRINGTGGEDGILKSSGIVVCLLKIH